MLTIIMVTGQPAPGWCDGDVFLNARPGLAGIYKVNKPVLIDVDVDNRGENIAGRLLLVDRRVEDGFFSDSFGGIVYGCEVNVPAGGKATYTIVAPGEVVSNFSQVILVAGDAILDTTSLQGAGVGGGMVVVPIDEKLLGSSLFAWLNKKYGGQVMVKYLPAEEFPDRPLLLRSADVILADRESASRLDAGRKKVLAEWVRLGGRLILAGDSAVAAGGPLEGLLPQGRDNSSGPVFRQPLGRGEVIVLDSALEGMAGRDEEVWEEMGLSSWLEDILNGRNMEMAQMEKNSLSESASYLPLSRAVGMPVLVTLWVAYILVVGPGLFILLKRINRSHLAWIMVPVVAVLTAVGLFTLSPVNRLKAYQSYAMSTVNIIDGDLAELASAGTFVLPRGGGLEVEAPEDMMLEPLNRYVQGGGRKAISLSGTLPRVVFAGVEYGAMRQVYSYGALHGAGAIEGTVFFRDDRLQGTIVNKTSFDLRDCRIMAGQSLIELGSIASGGTRNIDEPLNRWLVVSPGEAYSGMAPAVPSRESVVISKYTSSGYGMGEIVFMGWSDSPITGLKVITPSGQGQESGQTLFRQKLNLKYPQGPFRLPAGFIKNNIWGLDGAYSLGPDGLALHGGSVKVAYDLGATLQTERFTVSGIEIQQPPAEAGYAVELFNRETAGWDRMDRGSGVISGKAALKYVSGRGVIELRLTMPAGNTGKEGAFRGIRVEGVIDS
jgi:hypothetical protein